MFFSFFEKLWPVNLQDFDFFLHIDDVFLDDFESFAPLPFVLDLYLHQQVPLLSLGGEEDGLLASRGMLAADFNGCGHVERRGFVILAHVLVNELLDSLELFLLDITVQKQSSVVFVVVSHRS